MRMDKKIRVGIIYGGDSIEHDVSKMTAESVIEYIDRSLFDVLEIYIDKKGQFDENLLNDIDVAFLATHGPNYEDGKFQAYLNKKDIKYTGSKVDASKINMSKSIMHGIFRKAGLPTVKYLSFAKNDTDDILKKVSNNLSFPVFVKPDNTGSSIGIFKTNTINDLQLAIDQTFEFDKMIVIEEGIKHLRELEIGILGNDNLTISKPGEILTNSQFYCYESKYLNPFDTITKVEDLNNNEVDELQKLAKNAYDASKCCGYARVDFLMDENRNFYINEINTLPGFTKHSMFPKLMQEIGISYKDLITKIINLALGI